MAFVKKQGKTKTMWLPITVSTAIAKGTLVAWSSGYLIAATASSNPSTIAGVLMKAVAATDADYAVARKVPVEVPVEKYVIYEADVTSGLVAADRGLYCDLTDGATVNRAASTLDVVQCIEVISTTKGRFIINMGAEGLGVIGA